MLKPSSLTLGTRKPACLLAKCENLNPAFTRATRELPSVACLSRCRWVDALK